jgi:hypothetical protein
MVADHSLPFRASPRGNVRFRFDCEASVMARTVAEIVQELVHRGNHRDLVEDANAAVEADKSDKEETENVEES